MLSGGFGGLSCKNLIRAKNPNNVVGFDPLSRGSLLQEEYDLVWFNRQKHPSNEERYQRSTMHWELSLSLRTKQS